VIFVCEDNQWAISVPKSKATSIEWIADRAAGYGIPGIRVPENDAVHIYEAVAPAISRARSGEGPTLIEIKTDRYFGHFQGDPETYRPKDEVAHLRKNDPIPKLSQMLKEKGFLSAEQEAMILKKMHDQVDSAFSFARKSAYPDGKDALQDVFVNGHITGRALV
jgi:acetoin:2,6-dichlorophenolindophenol oxidoreductase subunit alpha